MADQQHRAPQALPELETQPEGLEQEAQATQGNSYFQDLFSGCTPQGAPERGVEAGGFLANLEAAFDEGTATIDDWVGPRTVAEDGRKSLQRAEAALAGLNTGDPAKTLDALRGMNSADRRAFFTNLAKMDTRSGGAMDRDAIQKDFEHKLLMTLSAEDYAEAMLHLDDSNEGTKFALRRALADPTTLTDSAAMYNRARSKLSLSDELTLQSGELTKLTSVSVQPLKAMTGAATWIDSKLNADEARAVDLLEKLPPAQRLKLLQDDEMASIRKRAKLAMEDEGTLKARWNELTDEGPLVDAKAGAQAAIEAEVAQRLGSDDPEALAKATRTAIAAAKANPAVWNQMLDAHTRPQDKAELLSLRTEEALRGTGRWWQASKAIDQVDALGIDLDSNRGALSAVLDEVEKDPAVAKAWAAKVRASMPQERIDAFQKGQKLSDLELVKLEIGAELKGRDLTWMDLAAPGLAPSRPGDAQNAAIPAARLDAQENQAEIQKLVANVSAQSGSSVSATQLLAWSATLSAGGQDAEALKAALQAKNIPLTDLEQIEAFDQQRQALQPALQAAKLVQAAENGVMDGPDGALNLLEDPELAAIDQAILDAKRSSHLYGPAELASLEAHQKTLLDTRDQRRQALDAAVAKASGSKFRDTAAMIRGTFQANSLVGLDEQALLLRMNRGGQLPLEEWMYACTKGLDTNVPEFEKRLAGRSPQEIAAAGAQFKKRYLAEYPELATIDDDRVVAHLIDSETDGLDRLRLKKAALGDATLVFNPKDTNLLGRTRTEQAAEALEIRRQSLRLDRETTQSGWLHEAANWGQAGERGTMNAAVMTESHQVETDAWIRKHTEGLQDGDPALWAQLDERMGLQSSLNGVENQQKTAVASRAKADIADLAASVTAIPGLTTGTKAAIAMASAIASATAEVGIQGDATDQDAVARQTIADGVKAAVGGVMPKNEFAKIAVGAAADVASDPKALREGRALDGFASKVLMALAQMAVASDVEGSLPRDTEPNANVRDFLSGGAGAVVGVLPKLLDGSLALGDLLGIGTAALESQVGGATGRATAFGTTATEARAKLAKHAPATDGPLKVTDEQIKSLYSMGLSPEELAAKGVPAVQLNRCR